MLTKLSDYYKQDRLWNNYEPPPGILNKVLLPQLQHFFPFRRGLGKPISYSDAISNVTFVSWIGKVSFQGKKKVRYWVYVGVFKAPFLSEIFNGSHRWHLYRHNHVKNRAYSKFSLKYWHVLNMKLNKIQ